jgi:hypothetical protein
LAEQDKQATMLQSAEAYRLAVGVFDVPHDLGNAVAELRSGGFTDREICLAGKRDVLDRALRGPSQTGLRIENWLTSQRAFSLRRLGIEGEDGEFVATSRGILRTLLDQSKARAMAGPSASFWPDLCHRLADHMRRDALVLLVSAKDAPLQSRSSRILLRHSTQSVQTYEFTPLR